MHLRRVLGALLELRSAALQRKSELSNAIVVQSQAKLGYRLRSLLAKQFSMYKALQDRVEVTGVALTSFRVANSRNANKKM